VLALPNGQFDNHGINQAHPSAEAWQPNCNLIVKLIVDNATKTKKAHRIMGLI
jgi:hypothetical protein